MLRRMKLFVGAVALVVLVAACGAITNADHQVNKMTDHGSSRGGSSVDGGPSTATDAGGDAGITSM